MINKDKIFSLFVDGKEIKDEMAKEQLKELINGPFGRIGMFVKLIQNHKIFHLKLEKFCPLYCSISFCFSIPENPE